MKLEIGTLTLDCLVPAGSTGQGQMQARLENLGRTLPHRLGQHLGAFGGETGVTVIRELAIDVSLDLDCPAEHNLERISRALATALARKFENGAQGIVRFPDKAAQLCSFLRDYLGGDAWSLWFHQPFSGASSLPPPRALGTVLAREPETSLAALALLTPSELSLLGRKLGTGVDLFRTSIAAENADDEPGVSTIEGMWIAAAMHGDCETAALLASLCAFRLHERKVPGSATLRVAAAIAEATANAAAASGASPRDATQPEIHSQSSGAGEPLRLGGLSPTVRSVLRALAGTHDPQHAAHRTGTSLGGTFLLLRDLDRLPLGALAGAEDCQGLSPAQSFRTLVLCRMAGKDGARVLLQDPVWRSLLGLPRQLGIAQLRAWADNQLSHRAAALAKSRPRIECVSPRWRDGAELAKHASRPVAAAAGWVLSMFSRRLPGFWQSSPSYLRRNILDVRATVEHDDFASVTITIDRPPLDPVLALSGAAAWEQEFDWTMPSRIAVQRSQP
jgi:hypothetical protein